MLSISKKMQILLPQKWLKIAMERTSQVYLESYDAWLRELSRLIEVYKRKARIGRDRQITKGWDGGGNMVISWVYNMYIYIYNYL